MIISLFYYAVGGPHNKKVILKRNKKLITVPDTFFYDRSNDLIFFFCRKIIEISNQLRNFSYEFCEYTDPAKARQVYQNGVEYYAALCRNYGLKAADIYGHYEAHAKGWASNHSDPKPYFATIGKTMEDF